MAYTDLESRHIDELLHIIKRKHSTPRISNIYPIYKDMVHDLQRTNHVSTTHHKKTVAVGALKQMFASKDETIRAKNEQIIEHHTQTITHLLHQELHTPNDTDNDDTRYDTRYTSKRKNNPCYCRSSCVIV